MSKVRTIVSAVNIIKMTLVEAKALWGEALASDNLVLLLIFFNLLPWNLSKFLQFVKIVRRII